MDVRFACNRPKEIKTGLSIETIQKMQRLLNIKL